MGEFVALKNVNLNHFFFKESANLWNIFYWE